MKILYTKYSNDRAPEFQIRTDILLKDNGEKAFIKSAVNEKACAHIERLFDIHNGLKQCFEKTIFVPNSIGRNENGCEFQFIKGVSLEELLDASFVSDDYGVFQELYSTFLDNIYLAANTKFEPGAKYNEVFGEWKLEGEYDSMPMTNIDVIFPNVLVKDGKWNIIDYEWSFDFPIPVKFVAFRAIHYYLSFGREKSVLQHIDMYEKAGISEEEKEYFLECENNFQRWLMSDYYSLWNANDDMKGRLYYPLFMAEKRAIADSKKNIIVFLYKNGKKTKEYTIKPDINEEGNCLFQINLTNEKTDKVEIYPYSGECSISVKGIVALEKNKNSFLPYSCNGQEIGDNKWAFFEKPCIVANDILDETENIYVEYDLNPSQSEDMMRNILWKERFVNEIEDKTEEIKRLKAENVEYEERIFEEHKNATEYKAKLDGIVNSKAWKLVKPLRKISAFIKKDNI